MASAELRAVQIVDAWRSNSGVSDSTFTGTENIGDFVTASIYTEADHNVPTSDETAVDPDSVADLATIVDIGTRYPEGGECPNIKRCTIRDLVADRGPSKIMGEATQPTVRWIHLPANCMAWVEDLMDMICRTRKGHTKEKLMRRDLWCNLYHGKEYRRGRVHTRFMKPICCPFSINLEDENSDSSGPSRRSKNNLVLYMPYFHWEEHQDWKERREIIDKLSRRKEAGAQNVNATFLKKYLFDPNRARRLHVRRTLKQAHYYHGRSELLDDLGVVHRYTNEEAKENQYLSRHQEEEEEEEDEEEDPEGQEGQRVQEHATQTDQNGNPKPVTAKMMMVDQLWLWVIEGSRGADAVSNAGCHSEPDLIITAFPGRLDNGRDPADVHWSILTHLNRPGGHHFVHPVNDLLAMIIEHCTGVFFQRQLKKNLWFLEAFANYIGSVRARQSHAFDAFRNASKGSRDRNPENNIPAERLNELYSVNIETDLIAEINSIIDDLGYIDFLSGQQQDVMASLMRAKRAPGKRKAAAKRPIQSLLHVEEIIKERRKAWADIAQTAQLVYDKLRDQMDTKQKQANVAEAKAAAHHGKVILLFTVVTIIFLPMSFLAAWFGINAQELNSGKLSLTTIAAVIFPVSIIIILLALVLAFNDSVREKVIETMNNVLDFVFCQTGLNGSRKEPRKRNNQGVTRDIEMGRLRPARM